MLSYLFDSNLCGVLMRKIEIVGMGCDKCEALMNNVKTAINELGLPAQVGKVDDIKEIVRLGIISTPSLIVDGVVRVTGRVADVEELVEILK